MSSFSSSSVEVPSAVTEATHRRGRCPGVHINVSVLGSESTHPESLMKGFGTLKILLAVMSQIANV